MNPKDDESTIYVTVRLRIPNWSTRERVKEEWGDFDSSLLASVCQFDEEDGAIYHAAISHEVMEAVWAKP